MTTQDGPEQVPGGEWSICLRCSQRPRCSQPALAGSLEVVVVGRDRAVRTQVLKDSESVSVELPGNLAGAAGRLMQRLAASSVALAAAPR